MPISLTSLVTSGQIPQPKDDLLFKGEPKSGFGDLVDQLQKMGARHGKKDRTSVQAIHDAADTLADGIHCCEMAEKAVTAEALAKANARHSAKDLERIKKVHQLSVELGAECTGTSKMDAADMEDSEASGANDAAAGKDGKDESE